MDLQKKFTDFKNHFFNHCTYLGIAGNGDYKRQLRINKRFFYSSIIILIICMFIGSQIKNGEWQIIVPVIIGVLLSFFLLFLNTKTLKRNHLKNLSKVLKKGSLEEYNLQIIISFLKDKYGVINSQILNRYKRYCRKVIDEKKLFFNISITFTVVFISVFLGALFAEIMSMMVGSRTSCFIDDNKNNHDLIIYIIYFIFCSFVFFMITYLQCKYTINESGELYSYVELENYLIELDEHIKSLETEANNDLIKQVLNKLKHSQKQNKQSWLTRLLGFMK